MPLARSLVQRILLGLEDQAQLPAALLLVAPLQLACHRLVIAGHRVERLVGDAIVQHLQVEHPDQRIAALDVRIEEGQRLALAEPLDPQRHLAQVHSQRVLVHAVDAVDDGLARPAAHRLRGRLVLSRRDLRQRPADPPRRGQQEVAGPARAIADAHGEERIQRALPGYGGHDA